MGSCGHAALRPLRFRRRVPPHLRGRAARDPGIGRAAARLPARAPDERASQAQRPGRRHRTTLEGGGGGDDDHHPVPRDRRRAGRPGAGRHPAAALVPQPSPAAVPGAGGDADQPGGELPDRCRRVPAAGRLRLHRAAVRRERVARGVSTGPALAHHAPRAAERIGPGSTLRRRGRARHRALRVEMSALALLVVLQALARVDTVLPYLAFPEPGLDDPAAYEGYKTRVYRDASGNALQVYVRGSSGRVVNLWADAANESVGFTVRDSSGRPAELAWGSSGAAVTASARTRSVSYGLEASSEVRIGLFLLGSMRVERDFQYAGRDSLPLDATPFPQSELSELIDHIARMRPGERARHLSLLGAKTIEALRARLTPRIVLMPREGVRSDTTWVVQVEQGTFDGQNHLWLALEGDSRETAPALSGGTVTIRRPAGGPVRLSVRVTTDAPALTPLSRAEIFNDDFRRFYEQARADTAHPLAFRRLEREVRGVELLCYGEKLMAGLPNFATYFGRDMFMTALLMQAAWAPDMSEHVVASALRKLSDGGDVSHEEALGGQAIRENAAEYNRLVRAGQLARARAVLGNLQAVRENYVMVDDDFQLPVVAARYLADPRVSAERKRRFLAAEGRLARLVSNLAFVTRQAQPYARRPVATNLVSFPRAPDGHWISASWRDSRG